MGDVTIYADGRLADEDTGESCKPPGPLDWILDGSAKNGYCVLKIRNRDLTPELLEDLIDTYGFMQKHGEIRVVLD